MERDELLTIVSNLRNGIENDEERDNIFTQLTDGITDVYTRLDTSASANSELTRGMEELRKANMKLFQKIGSEPSGNEIKDPDPEPTKAKRKFEDLFNEKGDFK